MRARRRHRQLTLDDARRPTGHGGWRPGAGRKCKPGAISHAQRPRFARGIPQHVTLRIVTGVSALSGEWLMKIIRRAIAESHKVAFRVVEFNVLSNHLHLITEAADHDALARGVQGLEVRLARRLNRALRRRGKLFSQRYFARYLGTPTQVRNALRYVLLNRKHHAAEKRFSRTWIDPCSSGAWFDGWAQPRHSCAWTAGLAAQPEPTARARTWLLAIGWRRLGPIAVDDHPG